MDHACHFTLFRESLSLSLFIPLSLIALSPVVSWHPKHCYPVVYSRAVQELSVVQHQFKNRRIKAQGFESNLDVTVICLLMKGRLSLGDIS